MSYVVIAELRAKPGAGETFFQLLDRHAARSRTEEPGCLVFEVSRHVEEPDLFLLYEVYRDADAYAAHRADPRYPVFVAAATPLLVDYDGKIFFRRHVLTRVSHAASAASSAA